MRKRTLLWRGLAHYRRLHASVLVGVALCSAVLVGALAVGDSVRGSLQALVRKQLGRVHTVVTADQRHVRADLAERLAGELAVSAASVLQVRGMASAPAKRGVSAQVQVLGVESGFWRLAREPAGIVLGRGDAAVDTRVASRLGVSVGDSLVLRVEKPSSVGHEMALVSADDARRTMRVRIAHVVPDTSMGRFSLRANQLPPENVFVNRQWLGDELGVPGRANLVLLGAVDGSACRRALGNALELGDIGLTLSVVEQGQRLELRSERVFLDDAVVTAAMADRKAVGGVMTYFVNRLESAGKATPYSFVCGADARLAPGQPGPGEVVINEWLAADLEIGPGDSLSMRYYVLTAHRGVREEEAAFRVKTVVPIEGLAADSSLMPSFPGLAEASNCRDWRPGVPLDLDRIRRKDEAYWDRYGGTPKAFVNLDRARRLWANELGSLTAVRFEAGAAEASRIANGLMGRIDAGAVGIRCLEIRKLHLRASAESVDFGQLFAGLSFFLVAGALATVGLLFVFTVEQRAEEAGVLLAVGIPRATVRRLLAGEGLCVACAGCAVGAVAGHGYNLVVIKALTTVWRDVVGTVELEASTSGVAVLQGTAAVLAAAGAVMWWVTRYITLLPVPGLLAGTRGPGETSQGTAWRTGVTGLVCLAAAAVLAVAVEPGRGRSAVGAFFGCGSLVLMGGLFLGRAGLGRLQRTAGRKVPSAARLGMRNWARKPRRSLTTTGVLACGVFMVTAVAANRQDAMQGRADRSSGTGGFTFFGETSIPVVQDLNESVGGATFVQMLVREGDDASCLNLNRVSHPRVLGVEPEAFLRREAFSCVNAVDGVDRERVWRALNMDLGRYTVPGVADQSVIEWGLGKKVGDRLTYVGRHGKEVDIVLVAGLANSVFQGDILVSEQAFRDHFGAADGRRVFLVDTDSGDTDSMEQRLRDDLADFGLRLMTTRGRLAAFNAVENTYLSIFLALGGLGLALGSMGLAVVVLRNTLERRGELALLRAVGYSRRVIWRMLGWEHGGLVGAGLVLGVGSAGVAVMPALLTPGITVPYRSLALLLGGMGLCGLTFSGLGALWATRGNMVSALRSE